MHNMKMIVLLVLGLALGVSLAGCGEGDAGADIATPERIIKVKVQRIEPQTLRDVLALPGNTEADGDVVLSAESSGRVEWVGPAEGDRVSKGEVIMNIDVSALAAKLKKAEATLRLAEDQAKRRKSLYAKGALSREELDSSLTALDENRASVAEARANFRNGVVRAPIAGVVNALEADPGEYVSPGTALVAIVNVDTVRVNVNVPEMDVRFLHKGDKVLVTVDAWPERQWSGVVDFVSSKADEGTRTFKVRVLVDNADGAIRPGMLARTNFLRREVRGSVAVPLSALLDRGGERVLFVAKDGVAKARTVQLGVLDGNLIQVTSGLELGEECIVAGQNEVEEGVKVSVQ